VSELPNTPAPSEATWVSEWDFLEPSCGHQFWIRMFGVCAWTVETGFPDPIEVELLGSQSSDGSIGMGICIHGDTDCLSPDEARMLARDTVLGSRRRGAHRRRRAISKRHIRNTIKGLGGTELPVSGL
jgi:hypothetical protein